MRMKKSQGGFAVTIKEQEWEKIENFISKSFENTKNSSAFSISNFVDYLDIKINMISMPDFAFKKGSNIFINNFLPSNTRLFMILHEVSHFVLEKLELESKKEVKNFSVLTERADILAIKLYEKANGLELTQQFLINLIDEMPFFRKTLGPILEWE